MKSEFIEHIEDYLEGTLSREELERQANELGVADLDQEIAWLRDSRIAIEAAGLRTQLKETLAQAQAPKTKIRRFFPSQLILTLAAGLALLLVVYLSFRNPAQPDLYAQYEYVDPGLPILMSQSEDYLLFDALTYFGEENYEVAAEKLQAIEDAYPQSDTLAYYLGASYLYLGKSDLARPALQRVLAQDQSRFRQKAEWLLVLTALKEEKSAEVSGRLQDILTIPEHEFANQAQALARDLGE
jgi:hypothetical protein